MSSKVSCDPSSRKGKILATGSSHVSTSQSYGFSLSNHWVYARGDKAGVTQTTPWGSHIFPGLLRSYHHAWYLRELCTQSVPTAWKKKVWQKNFQCFTYIDSLNKYRQIPNSTSFKLPTLIFPPLKLQGWEHVCFPHLGFATYSDSHVAPNHSFLLSTCHSSSQSHQAYVGTGLSVSCSWPFEPCGWHLQAAGNKES